MPFNTSDSSIDLNRKHNWLHIFADARNWFKSKAKVEAVLQLDELSHNKGRPLTPLTYP